MSLIELVKDKEDNDWWASIQSTTISVESLDHLNRDWATNIAAQFTSRRRVTEQYIEFAIAGKELLANCVEVDPDRSGGLPVLKGTRFTISQVFAEFAENEKASDIAKNFDLDEKLIIELLNGVSLITQRKF